MSISAPGLPGARLPAALERLKPYHAIIIRRFSWDALSMFKDRSLDFVYIDAITTTPISAWTFANEQEVRRGGLVSGTTTWQRIATW